MFAICDANNFYCSCEKSFEPALQGRPVVVLSNNDGCVVARSPEAKALGIKMGDPVFRLQDIIRRHRVVVRSSNYPLYGDMSARFMAILGEFTPRLEVYSIDEAFLDLSGFRHLDLVAYGREMRQRVLRSLGLPICVGIAPTKTLAKAANWVAKKDRAPAEQGVLYTPDRESQTALLAQVPVEEVWGVGPRLTPRLHALGLRTALQLRDADPRVIRRRFGVVLERTVRELQGLSCLALEEVASPRQQIVVSRSFGRPVEELGVLTSAVVQYASRAAEKLRAQDSAAARMTVFIETNSFDEREPQYSRAATVGLSPATQDSRMIIRAAVGALRSIFRRGFRFKRAGVMLLELSPARTAQGELFEADDKARGKALMDAIDSINKRYGRDSIVFGSKGLHRHWRSRSQQLSPAYTTRWSDLVRVRA